MSTCAWIIGTCFLGEPYNGVAVLGIILFLCGVLGMSYVKANANGSLLAPLQRLLGSRRGPQRLLQSYVEESGADVPMFDPADPNPVEGAGAEDVLVPPRVSYLDSQMGGLVLAVLSGFFFSLQGVPLHYSAAGSSLENGASCYLTTGPLMLMLNGPFVWHAKRKQNLSWKELVDVRKETDLAQALKLMLIPMAGGLVFSVGGIGQELGVEYLGSAVALPVSQLQLIVSGLWGILLYKEIYKRQHIVVYFLFAGLAVLGSAMLH